VTGYELPFNFFSIIWLDIVLSGDNALIIGLAASSLSPHLRRRAILFGLVLAAVMRIVFASMTTYLMHMPGLLFVGGAALMWVSWRLYKELRAGVAEAASGLTDEKESGGYRGAPRRSLASALFSITIADLSMSIDNVLAVAAIARDNLWLLVFGLVLSIALMGLCATLIVKFLVRWPWISYIGVALLVFVGAKMLWEGWPSFAGLIGLA
jgi:YjbE family integral membrane protein